MSIAEHVNDAFDAGPKGTNPLVPNKKKRAPRKPKVKAQRSAPWHIALQPLILQSTIRPLLVSILQSTPNLGGPSALFLTFCSKTQAKVSRSVFNSWLKDLGITFRQTTTFSLPDGTDQHHSPNPPTIQQNLIGALRYKGTTTAELDGGTDPLSAGGGVSPDDGDDVTFANETPRDRQDISAQAMLAAASLNADTPRTPDGIPLDQLVITPKTASFL